MINAEVKLSKDQAMYASSDIPYVLSVALAAKQLGIHRNTVYD